MKQGYTAWFVIEKINRTVSRCSGFDSRGDEYGGRVQLPEGERGVDPAIVDQPEESPNVKEGEGTQ